MQRVFNNCGRRMATGIVWVLLLAGGAAAQGWQHVGDVQRVEKLADGVELTAGAAKIRITAHFAFA